jgi:cell division protein FtsB
MTILTEIRRRGRRIAGPVAAVSLVVYFSYHLVEGDRSLMAWRRLSGEIQLAQAQLSQSESERSALQQRVSLLRPNHLDRDLLDERARAALNLAARDERVIFLNEPLRP